MTTSAERPERVIKRYENRKLYDPQARRHVTLDDLAACIGAGEDIRVVDQRSGEDLTTVVLAQVILEGLKQRTTSIPHQVLTRLIRLANGPAAGFADWIGPAEAASRARDEAERIVGGLMSRGRLTLDEALALRQEMAGSVHRLVSEAQAGVEARVRGLLERPTPEAGVSPALQALRRRLQSFESLLGPPPAPEKISRASKARKTPRTGTRKKSRKI